MPNAAAGMNISNTAQVNPGTIEGSDIANDTIENADIKTTAAIELEKLENISATKRILARNTAGAGPIEEVTLDQVLDWLSGVGNGDMIVRSGGAWVKLSPGAAGEFLTSNGAGLAPSFGPGGDAYAVGAGTQNNYLAINGRIVPSSATAANGWTLNAVTFSVPEAGGSHTISPTSSANLEMSCGLLGSGSAANASYATAKSFMFKMAWRLDDTVDRKAIGFCITPANIHTAQTDITNGEARFVWNGSTLYAQNANGSAATSTDISSGITATQWNTYEIIVTPGTDIKFYVNGTLKATHTTNLPTSGTPIFAIGTNANGRVHHITEPVFAFQR